MGNTRIQTNTNTYVLDPCARRELCNPFEHLHGAGYDTRMALLALDPNKAGRFISLIEEESVTLKHLNDHRAYNDERIGVLITLFRKLHDEARERLIVKEIATAIV